MISEEVVERVYSYSEYRTQVDENVLKMESSDVEEKMLHYTKMNVQRMKRIEKTTVLNEELIAALQSVQEDWTWFVLTEGWCGDAAQNVPVIAKMADLSPHITLKLVLRDDHEELMNQYLTEGGKSIPKLICINNAGKELGVWGPRPEAPQQMMRDYKASGDTDYQKLVERMQLWYAKDKTAAIQAEFIALLKGWKS